MGVIEIEGMEFYAYHGHYDSERKVGNKFLVDLKIETNCSKAAESDNLDDALDYQQVYKIVKAEMAIASALLENVAWRIAGKIRESFSSAQKISVKVSKINPPLGGPTGKVSVFLSV